ncbi:MAG: hypothetical protein [Caudoviricetes sp.]|nr:MAG: hypothetical protein [Caudoviricetes sp.]
MNVNMLGMHGTKLVHYSSEPERAILHLLACDSTLVMEPGELADFAKGHKFLMDSQARIIELTPDDYCMAKAGDYYHIFMPVTITEQTVYAGTKLVVRKISPSSYLTAY